MNSGPAFGLLLISALLPGVALAATSAEGPQWGWMAVNLLGGLALFLFGMDQMADALKAVAGERMKLILARLTTNRFTGAVTGAAVTAVIQSSSVTTVLVVGFISAGLMSMAQSVGVIMGANIGTTITAQIVAFKVTKAALGLIAAGFGMLFLSKRETIRHYGGMLMGLGLIFFGMGVMSHAMEPLRSYQPFLDLMKHMDNAVLGILVAAAFTALVQSSSATTGIVIVMASQGFITLPAGIALAFGANIGTCVTAVMASIGKPREAVRAALVHVLFNVLGVLLWFGFIDQLADAVRLISPASPELTGMDRLAHETPRQIANAHTLFNIANTLIFIGFTAQLARLVEWLVPDRPTPIEERITPRYLEPALLETPALALDRARLEVARIGDILVEMLDALPSAFLQADRPRLAALAKRDEDIDILHQATLKYLGEVSAEPLTSRDVGIQRALMGIANDLEAAGDLIETDLVALGMKYDPKRRAISDDTSHMLEELHDTVMNCLRNAVNAVQEGDAELAHSVIARKSGIQKLVDDGEQALASRLNAHDPDSLKIYAIEISVIEKLRRIYYFAKRICKSVDALVDEETAVAEEEPETA